MVGTAGTIVTAAFLIASIADSGGMNVGSTTWQVPLTSGMREPQTNPNALKFGSALRNTSSSVSLPMWSTHEFMLAQRFAWVRGTAFGSPVVPIFASRQPKGGHIVHILPALHYIETGDEDADMYRLTEECVRVTEDFIRQHPDEWLWFQHRWMTKMDQIIDYDKKIAARERAHEKQ